MSKNKEDIADRVFITLEARDAWVALAQKTARAFPSINPSEIGEEIIYLNPDEKTLTMSCSIRGGEVKMVIPEGHWSYIAWAQ